MPCRRHQSSYGGQSEVEREYKAWDDSSDDEYSPKNKKSKTLNNSWNVDSEVDFHVMKAPNKTIVIKETTADQNIKLVKMLLNRYGANNASQLNAAIGKLKPGEDSNYKDLWKSLSSRSNIMRHVRTAAEELKIDVMHKPFEELIDDWCRSNVLQDPEDYEPPKKSYFIFKEWCVHNNIDLCEFITQTMDVMNRKLPKINTMCIIGGSNSGKTVVYANPIAAICRFIGVIGNRGNDSPFLFMECPNTRAIVINEGLFRSAHYEDLKGLMGGEPINAQVKYEGDSTIQRTPVIITGNKDPWVLDESEALPMRNRMFYYKVSPWEELAEVKYLHPGMWWYLMQHYGEVDRITDIKKMRPYPETRRMNEEEEYACLN